MSENDIACTAKKCIHHHDDKEACTLGAEYIVINSRGECVRFAFFTGVGHKERLVTRGDDHDTDS